MNLAFRLSGPEAIVYRKPWGVIAFSLCMAAICVGSGTGFGLIGYRESESLVGIPFMIIGGIFGTFGVLILAGLISNAGTWLRDGGVPLAIANTSGLTVWPNLNAKPQSYAWPAIDAIILADGLTTIDGNETAWSRGQFVVFLYPNVIPPTRIGRLTAQLATSGKGKPYISTDFQHRSARELEVALRRLAPAHVLIRRCKRAIFDRTSQSDRYETA